MSFEFLEDNVRRVIAAAQVHLTEFSTCEL